ncbi:hypothetical protein GCM10025862_14800 [Arsenicicoccus piscis]|uniref:DUF7455 domain-containing protein n=1 Tax=Arsenicicoccus piscis TaxID=673954 RepID=A0ABQ6HPU8_9MICO|nr:hypothetical protein GCM10025862_14800 [Arsenicicoccus piscis]
MWRSGLHPGPPGHGGELLFCAHHGREHLDKLKTIAVEIDDQTARLVESTMATEL